MNPGLVHDQIGGMYWTGEDYLIYDKQTASGKQFVLVDLQNNETREAFDREALAKALGNETELEHVGITYHKLAIHHYELAAGDKDSSIEQSSYIKRAAESLSLLTDHATQPFLSIGDTEDSHSEEKQISWDSFFLPNEPDTQLSSPSLKAINISGSELNALAALAILESGTQCQVERLDVAHVVFNRMNSPAFPSTVRSVVFQKGQFEPFFGHQFWEVSTQVRAASFVSKKRGMSYARALEQISRFKANLQDPNKMRNARSFVGGRTYFKGVTQYKHRVANEDPRRKYGCNFFHIGNGQSYGELISLENRGPESIRVQ